MTIQNSKFKIQKFKGIAIVAVLAILTVLALLAAGFVTMTSMQSKTSKASLDSFRAKLLVESGLSHAASLIQQDSNPKGLLCDSVETDPLTLHPKAGEIWHIVKDENGTPIGRYRIKITDESGKLNVNFLPELAQHVVLKSKKDKKDPRKSPLFSFVDPKIIKKILAYQYGPNRLPGLRNIDDNDNNLLFENDGIDNNFNGKIDELGEGIDDPSEFNPLYPKGDDRSIGSIAEVADFLQPLSPDGKPPKINKLSKVFSTRSNSKTISQNEDNKNVNINGATVREIAQGIRKRKGAKMGADLSRFACNIADFRDENHVISTYAGGYGVEAICFSEVMANDASHMLEPHVKNWIPTGNGNQLEEKYCGVVGAMLDPYDKETSEEPVAKFPMRPTEITKVGANVKVKYDGPPLRDSLDPTVNYKKLFNILKKRGKTSGENINYPIDFWKNGHMILRMSTSGKADTELYEECPKIITSDARTVTVEGKWGDNRDTYDDLVSIQSNKRGAGFWLNNHWERMWGQFTVHPQCSEWAITEIRPETYFKVYIGNNSFTPVAFKDNSPLLDCDGDPSSTSWTREKLLKWEYKGGRPVRTDSLGFIDVIVTSSRNCDKEREDGVKYNNHWMWVDDPLEINKTKSVMTHNIFMRPDIIELVNISDKPVSLAGWRVLLNTGSVALELCRIDSVFNYDKKFKSKRVNQNPVIPPNGYGYLTSDEAIFDIEYGNNSKKWGDSRSESYFCYQLPVDAWGIWYKIKGFRPGNRNLWEPGRAPSPDNNIILEGADFEKGEMSGEIIEFRSKRRTYRGNNLNGFRRAATANTKDAVEILYGHAGNDPCDITVGDYAVILGMPRNGGFLSFTLRDEYNQITSRTIEYGKLKYDEYDRSTERTDPTVMNSWKKTFKPTFGGKYSKARPKRKSARKKLVIQNRPLGSYKDMLNISSGKAEVDYRNEHQAKKFLNSYGALFSLAGKRLDSESAVFSPGISKKNAWKSTLYSVANSSKKSISAQSAKWKPDMWKEKTLTFLSGKSRGEQFKIESNGKSTLKIQGRSTQNSNKLAAEKGDKFIVGPSFKTPLFYCQDSGAQGIWEWKDTGLNPETSHDLYFFGLNDSINTTEFLEENHNAKMTVTIWNYKTQKWDLPPKKRYIYNKNDSFYFGKVLPNNISEEGTLKISIVPHNLVDEIKSEKAIWGEGISYNLAEEGASGIAWFDYIYVSPTERPGRININTADARILATLPGVSLSLAKKIEEGINSDKKKIRPYKNIFDLLKVKGMTTDILCEIADYLTVRSDTYRVDIESEIFNSPPKSKKVSEDNIIARQNSTFVIEREKKNENDWQIIVHENIDVL